MVTIPEFRIGDPIRCDGVTVCPLFTGGESALDYVLAEEAMNAETLVVSGDVQSGLDLRTAGGERRRQARPAPRRRRTAGQQNRRSSPPF